MTQSLLYVIILQFFISLSNEKGVTNEVIKKWQDYKLNFGKVYESPEVEERHLSHFVNNLKSIDYHNKREKREVLGLTQFSDQVCSKVLGCTASVVIPNSQRSDIRVSPKYHVRDKIDWRQYGYVTAVQNQDVPRQCGSCWAISAAGAIEGHIAKSMKKQAVKLSVQQLVDCSHTRPNAGCTGGNPLSAFLDVKKTGIVASKDYYPYTGQAGICHLSKTLPAARVIGYNVLTKNEYELKEAVAILGPISVTIDITNLCHYKPGTVFNARECYWHYDNSRKIRRPLHSVLVVGYGTDRYGMDYWLIKNSWGTTWGDRGYFKLARNRGNRCGIANQAIYPILQGEQRVCTWKIGNFTLSSSSNRITPWLCSLTSKGIKHQFNSFFLFGSFVVMLVLSNTNNNF